MNRGSTLIHRNLMLDGKPFYMRGAEIQYFRLPRSSWNSHLKQARASGMNTITTCMPWHFHEPEEGTFDFRGETKAERNLLEFMDLVQEYQLKLVAHPGPFMNCEFRTGGIPEWLFRNHPETLSRRADGNIATGRPIPAEGEPLYRKYVRKWYEQVVPLFAERQADRGGPIILFQPDNELSAAWSYGLLNSLYDPHVIHTLWPQWLEGKYSGIVNLNTTYGTTLTGFGGVAPPRTFPASPGDKTRCHDWLQFKREFFADWGATLAGWARDLGMNTPVIFNEPVSGFYGHGDHSGFGSALKKRGLQGTTVCHSYADRICDLEGMVHSLMGLELTKASPWGGPPLSVEVNTNWFIPRLSRSAINWSPLLRSNLAHGMRGYSVFPFSEALADLADSINGPAYFPGSCLDSQARPVASQTPVELFNRLVETWESYILDMPHVPDITLTYSPALRTVDFLGASSCLARQASGKTGPGGSSFDAEPALQRESLSAGHDWLDGYENVSKQTAAPESGGWVKLKECFMLLSRLNVQFDLLDLVHPSRPAGTGWLVVPCTGTMEREGIDYLLEHLDRGGGCLFFPTLPQFHPCGARDSRLEARFGIQLQEQIPPAGGEILRYGAETIQLTHGRVMTEPGWISVHRFPAGSEILATREGKPVIARAGRVIVSGVDARFTTYDTLAFWDFVLTEKAGLSPAVRSRGNYYYTTLLGTVEKGLLTVVNSTGNSDPGELLLKNGLSIPLELGPTEARTLPLNLELDGVPLVYSSSEILRSPDRRAYELHGHPGSRGRLAFLQPATVELNGKVRKARPEGNLFIVDYIHQIKAVKMRLPPPAR